MSATPSIDFKEQGQSLLTSLTAISTNAQEIVMEQLPGIFAGMTRAVVGHPFDTVKVKIQTHPELYKSSTDALMCTIKTDGVLGLYKGLAIPLVGNILITSVHFGVYNRLHEQMGYNPFFAGAVAGVGSTFIAAPMEYVRIKMQLSAKGNVKYKGVIDCARHIVRSGGNNPLSLYRGFGVTAAREAVGYAAFFGTYSMVQNLTGVKLVDDIIRGSLCGFALWGTMYPIDVVKSRIQGASVEQAHHNAAWHFRDVYTKLGWRGFFKGYDATMVRAVPVNIGIVFAVQLANRLRHESVSNSLPFLDNC